MKLQEVEIQFTADGKYALKQARRGLLGALMASHVIMLLTVVLITHSVGHAQIPDGFFTDRRKVTNLDQGEYRDENPFVTPDGLTMYFNSERPHSSPDIVTSRRDIFMATRTSVDAPFGAPVRIDSISLEGTSDHDPFLSADGSTIYFNSGREGGTKTFSATLELQTDEWSMPTLLTLPVSSEFDEMRSIRFFDDGLRAIFYANENGTTDLYEATRESVSESFVVRPLSNLNTSNHEEWNAHISSDGLTLIYPRGNQGSFQNPQLYISFRPNVEAEFGEPERIDNAFPGGTRINFNAAVTDPFLTADWPAYGSKLYFMATGNLSDFDIYEATWQFVPGLCDLNDDGNCDITDLDLLFSGLGSEIESYDLNNSGGPSDRNDVEIWLSSAGNETIGLPFSAGDANLDGRVDVKDLNNLALNWQQDIALWSAGDFTADGIIDTADLNELALNWLQSIPVANAAPVPEPSTLLLTLIGLSLVWRRTRCR